MVSGRNTARPFFRFASAKSFEADTTLLQSQGVKMDFGGVWKEHGKTIFSIRFCEVFLKLTRRCCRARASRWILVVSGRNTARQFFNSLLRSLFETDTTLLQSQGFKMDFGGVWKEHGKTIFRFASAKSF